jgi:hypothetical protein
MASKKEEKAAFGLLKKHFKNVSLMIWYRSWADTNPTYSATSIDTNPGICGSESEDPMKAALSLLKKAGKEVSND